VPIRPRGGDPSAFEYYHQGPRQQEGGGAVRRSPGEEAGASDEISLGIENRSDCWGGANVIPIGAKRFSHFSVPKPASL